MSDADAPLVLVDRRTGDQLPASLPWPKAHALILSGYAISETEFARRARVETERQRRADTGRTEQADQIAAWRAERAERKRRAAAESRALERLTDDELKREGANA